MENGSIKSCGMLNIDGGGKGDSDNRGKTRVQLQKIKNEKDKKK